MKFLYGLPFLLPQVASACVGSNTDTSMVIVASMAILVVGISLAINIVLLIVMKLLPSNKGLTMAAVFTKAKKPMLIVIGSVTVTIFGYIFALYTVYACL